MERAKVLLGGKFLFKRQNDRTIDKTKVVCSICQAEFSYHLAEFKNHFINTANVPQTFLQLNKSGVHLNLLGGTLTRE